MIVINYQGKWEKGKIRTKRLFKNFIKLQVCYTVDHHTQPLTAFSKKKSMSPFSRMKNLL